MSGTPATTLTIADTWIGPRMKFGRGSATKTLDDGVDLTSAVIGSVNGVNGDVIDPLWQKKANLVVVGMNR